MQLSDLITTVFEEVVATLVLALLGVAFRTLVERLRQYSSSFLRRQESAIIKVSKDQVKEFTAGRVQTSKERKDAIDYLTNDLSTQLEQLRSPYSAWRNYRFVNLLDWRNGVALSVAIIVFQVLGQWLFGENTQSIVYSILGVLLLAEIALLSLWFAEGNKLDKRYKQILKEANRALIVLGPKLRINLRELLTSIYTHTTMDDPVLIQKQLRSIGFVIERSELMRVSLAYLIRNKPRAERRAIISNIISAATNNPSAYHAISDEEREKIELMMLNDYVDDPYAEVEIVSI